MKIANNLIFLALTFLFFFTTCNKNKVVIEDPQKYNKTITGIILPVQIKVDSLEAYLLNLKFELEQHPDSIFYTKNIDSIFLLSILQESKKQIKTSKKQIKNIEFANKDTLFKPAILKGLKLIDFSLENDFSPLIDTIFAYNGKKNSELITAMLKHGKQGYINYSAAFDTIITGQMKFNRKHNYIIEKNIIKFRF